jgi:D-alanyl-D-alanine carboxypeptidase
MHLGRTGAFAATLTLAGIAVVACAPSRETAPPDPQLVPAEHDAPTLSPVSTTPGVSTRAAPSTAALAGGASQLLTGVDEPSPAGWEAFDESLRDQLLPGGDVAASVAVSVHGELQHAAAFGVRVPNSLEPVDTDDRFRLGSLSKVVTAIVTLQLVEDGRLALDEPVGDRLAASLGVSAVDPDMQAVTPRMLLSHRSGIHGYDGLFFSNGAATCADAARVAMAQPVSPPGGFDYSNMNYCLLGLLIEHVTALAYDEAESRWLLAPLGLHGMRAAGTSDVGPDEVSHFTTPGRRYMEALGAAGAWIATPTDVVTILDSLDPTLDRWHPLSDEMLMTMRSQPFVPYATAGYGLGLIMYADGSYGHTGTLESTHAMALHRGDGVTWAVTVSGEYPAESEDLRSIVDRAFAASGMPGG